MFFMRQIWGRDNLPERSEGRESLENFVTEHYVLELLLAQHLSRLLTATNQVRHHYLGGTVRQELVDFMLG